MSQIFFSLSIWLHALGTVILIGHYLLLSLIYLPSLAGHKLQISGPILSEISKRSRVWMYISLLIFIVTGIYLMIVDPNYLGVGDFGNLWGILMLVKHILILAMIAMGFWFNGILCVGPPDELEYRSVHCVRPLSFVCQPDGGLRCSGLAFDCFRADTIKTICLID